jgi:hypothetical protein
MKSGNYVVMVTDSKGVQGIKQIIISEPDQLSIEFEKNNNCDNTHKVKGIVSGGNYPYTYKWNNSTYSTTDSVILNSGDYKLSITDSKGCKKTGDISIAEYIPMVIDTSIIDSIECKYKTGGLYVKVINGKKPYTYKWNTNDTNNYLNDIYSGEYSLTATDKDGCAISDTFILEDSEHGLIYDKIYTDSSLVISSYQNMIVRCYNDSFDEYFLSNDTIKIYPDTFYFEISDTKCYKTDTLIIEKDIIDTIILDTVFIDDSINNIEKITINNLKIYPNPVINDIFFIYFKNNYNSDFYVELYNSNGVLLFYEKYNIKHIWKEVILYNKGMFYVRIYNNNGLNIVKKVINYE